MRVVTEGREAPDGTRVHYADTVTLGPDDLVHCRHCSRQVKVSDCVRYPGYDWIVHPHSQNGVDGEIVIWGGAPGARSG